MHTSLEWIAFNLFVVIAVALDLGVFHRKAHKISVREALLWSLAWIALAVTFGLILLYFRGRQPALEFFTGYIVEKALSVDNLFVFLVVFRVFAVKDEYQQRVLGYGILGALLLRGAMIAVGAALIAHFSWIMYAFGAFIVLVGFHMLIVRHEESDPQTNFLVRYFSRHLRLTKEYRGAKFFVRENGQFSATPGIARALFSFGCRAGKTQISQNRFGTGAHFRRRKNDCGAVAENFGSTVAWNCDWDAFVDCTFFLAGKEKYNGIKTVKLRHTEYEY